MSICPSAHASRGVVIAVCLAAAAATRIAVAQPADAPPTPGAQASDQTLTAEAFAQKAALSGLKEVELSRIAIEKVDNSQVRQFAQQILQDHTRANEELKRIAQSKGIQLPATNSLSPTPQDADRQPVSQPEDATRPQDQERERAQRDQAQTTSDPASREAAGTSAKAEMAKMKEECKATIQRMNTLSGDPLASAYVQQMVQDHAKGVQLFEKASQSLTDNELKRFATQTLPTLRNHHQMAMRLSSQLGGVGRTTTENP
jgi:putative membrane protein